MIAAAHKTMPVQKLISLPFWGNTFLRKGRNGVFDLARKIIYTLFRGPSRGQSQVHVYCIFLRESESREAERERESESREAERERESERETEREIERVRDTEFA